MTWATMSMRLAKGGHRGEECAQLTQQETIRSTLYDSLSDIVKDRDSGFPANLDNLWAQSLDHIYVVLDLVQGRTSQ